MTHPICAFVLTAGFVAGANAQTSLSTPRVIKLATEPIAGSLAPTGDRAAYVGKDKKLYVLNLADGISRGAVQISTGDIERMVVSPGGNWIFIGDHVGDYFVWNADTGKAQIKLHLGHYPGAAIFSADGKLLAIAPASEPVQIFESATGRKVCETTAVTGGVQAIAFSRDGKLLATADSDTVIRIYDVRSGHLVAKNSDFLLEPLAVEFTSDGTQVIASGADKVIVFLDAATGKLVRKLPKLDQPVSWSSLSVSPDGKSFAAVLMVAEDLTKPRTVVVWDVATGEKLSAWTPPAGSSDLAWTSDNHLIFLGGQTDSVSIWRIR